MNIDDYKYNPAKLRQYTNIYDIPINRIEKIEEFNDIYAWFRDRIDTGEYIQITRTPSGGISKKKECFSYHMYDVEVRRTGVCLTLLDGLAQYRFLWGARHIDTSKEVTGREAFNMFVDVCNKYSVDLSKYAILDGKDVKQEIQTPIIDCAENLLEKTIKHCHHLDLNSSFFSGIIEAYPELRGPVEDIYAHRKDDTQYGKQCKDILTHTYGFMQSRWCRFNHKGYALANMSKSALDYNNAYIRSLDEKIRDDGFLIVAHNTDGIWYTDGTEREYHDENEGPSLGQWKNDHHDTTIRFKSKGAYEYIEDGVYTAVVRGLTKFDKVEPDRKKWQWGDIFKSDVITWSWDDEKGIVME